MSGNFVLWENLWAVYAKNSVIRNYFLISQIHRLFHTFEMLLGTPHQLHHVHFPQHYLSSSPKLIICMVVHRNSHSFLAKVITRLQGEFFPGGRNDKGRLTNMTRQLCNSDDIPVDPAQFTLGSYAESCQTKATRLYLMTKLVSETDQNQWLTISTFWKIIKRLLLIKVHIFTLEPIWLQGIVIARAGGRAGKFHQSLVSSFIATFFFQSLSNLANKFIFQRSLTSSIMQVLPHWICT